VVDDLVERLRTVVEGRHRGQHDGAHLSQSGQNAQVAEVQRRLPDHEDQRASFFERHVGSPGDERVGVAGGDGGRGLDGARRDDHAGSTKRPRGQRGADVLDVVAVVGQRFHVGHAVVGLLDQRALAGGGDDQVQLDVGRRAQHLQQADPVDRPAGAGDADDEAAHSRNRRR
jgi:hypothetical protein